jgi:formylglycine-generating enzyme required for sulfatase activity
MDYLQSLESRMASLQRKIRLLQDLRFFIETADPEELAGFGDELRSIETSKGTSVGSALAALLGSRPGVGPQPAIARAPQASSEPAPIAPSASAAPPAASAPSAAVAPRLEREEAPAPAGTGLGEAVERARSLILPFLKEIPAGSFVMGSEIDDTEKPPHKVVLGAFALCDHLITNTEYALFLEANPEWTKDRADPELRDGRYLEEWGPGGFPEGKEEHPASFVSFYAAEAFARWLGLRLPTEAEWERAARGGLVGKKFPNGDQMNDKLANLAKQNRGTTPVRKYEPNGFGLYDMAGNLFEWTSDWYGPYSAGEASDPKGPREGEYKAVRGGSWMSGAGALRVGARVDMEPRTCGQVGIRLAR